MIIDKKTLDFWKLNKKQGTITHIKNLTGISRVTITNAIINGHGTQNTVDIINQYFINEIENENKRARRKKPVF